ncbi:stage V sporulation protein AD [Papillibacter cinnamivorans]|uniref:Stage V sporulation protein AD n=1 Tax=Papillibacter cinnamivorans DSM 12816 TaxID=1122930 RepID=A0A1W1ZIV2_9FIRM|nr:stage V sporulation protein AD [Papillibacter cinnamivorans]SMC47951.1 stage V sporulation protein AD [Papillibacter cinnamivorans DSM 12816]
MDSKRVGKRTVRFSSPPSIAGEACVVGRKEGDGPLAATFDYISQDPTFGETSWEKAESRMQKDALNRALDKAGIPASSLEYIFAGDLLNQCIGTSFGLREFGVPFYGLYGACSTMAESLSLAAMAVDGGFASWAAALTSSHFCSAERQYRTPLEYGGQRTPTAQWTVTGSGACILTRDGPGPYITHATAGKIVDKGIKDAANMGAAMAPAAYETLVSFFTDTNTTPRQYDLIVTGDLGLLGKEIVTDFFAKDGLDVSANYTDCGVLIYDIEKQDMHMGASGCGCSAVVLAGHLLSGLREGRYGKILFAGTGALLSPVSTQQGESIPSVCHLVCISNGKD